MRVTIFGKRWKFKFARLPRDTDGECDHPDTTGKEIRISMRLRGKDLLETIIHEHVHAGDFTKSEEWVETFSRDLTRVIWKLGYRRKEDLDSDRQE